MSTTTREEWEVTGDPGQPYPPYRFVYGTPIRNDTDPEALARQFVADIQRLRANGTTPNWVAGPFLRHRVIIESEWETVET